MEADVLSISVPRNMFIDDKLENLQKLIEGKQTLFKRAFRVYRFTHVFIKLYTVFCNDNADYMHSI